jgi:D-glycero-alpha-D-manno-heptose 1-phosphate guanylyltransferase
VDAVLPVAGVIILAGGVGSRLQSVLVGTQKVVAPIAGRPMLGYLLAQCARSGVREVTLAVGYRAEQVREVLGDRYEGIRIRYSVETSAMGTGGAIALAAGCLPRGPKVILNGDSFVDVDLAAVVAWHRAHRARATVVLTEVTNAARFGSVTVGADGRVEAFAEKAGSDAARALVNAGVYVMEADVLDEMPVQPHSVERDVLPRLAGRGLFGWRVPGRFIDIGLPETYAAAAEVLAAPPSSATRRAYVVLDRDGTVIEDGRYLHDPAAVALLPNAAAGLRQLQAAGLGLVIATNQAGIGRGLYADADFHAVQRRLDELLAAEGVRVDATYYCPHHPDAGCACRKPATGMIEQARGGFGGDGPVAVIGDKRCDIDLARAVGAGGILVTTGYGEQEFARGLDADFLVDDLLGAAHVVDELVRHPSLSTAAA